jgi:serine/threonine-protein kinase
VAGRYELLEIAGRGGMAVVWRAEHHGPGKFRRPVAVKQMHAHLAKNDLYRTLFEEEARVGSLVQDPNIAQIYDFVVDDGELYLVMEWVNGIDLATFLHYVCTTLEEKTRWEVVAAIGIGVLRGLAAAHERTNEKGEVDPILHRDICPHNVLISDRGRAKLIDFGLSFSNDRDIEDTDPGIAKGKLAYLAPEIVRGGRPTPATDQFAVGAVLWESLVGRRAFRGENELEVYKRVANAEIEKVLELRPDLPKRFAAVVHRALARDPQRRFGDCREMARQLGGVLREHKRKEDLYALLGETVVAARARGHMGAKTQDPATETPSGERRSGLVELLVQEKDRPTGFRRWIPSFLRDL